MANNLTHIVIDGDTLPAIAQKYLEDSTRWLELAILNELEYPFILHEERTSETSTKVKCIGENLLIPIEAAITNQPIGVLFSHYERVLGEDIDAIKPLGDFIQLDRPEQLEFSADTYGDLKIISGLQNLKQSILLRLMTPKGTLLHHPHYGTELHKLIGKKSTARMAQRIKLEIERTIRTDNRVEDVVVSSVVLDGNTAKVNVQITPIGIPQVLSMGISFDQTGVIVWD